MITDCMAVLMPFCATFPRIGTSGGGYGGAVVGPDADPEAVDPYVPDGFGASEGDAERPGGRPDQSVAGPAPKRRGSRPVRRDRMPAHTPSQRGGSAA